MKRRSISRDEAATLLKGVCVLVGLYLTSLYSYLLFHSLAEVFSIVIACSVFVLAWNSRRFLNNDYLVFLGMAYLFIGGMDLMHTLAYQGMGVFQEYDANLPTQLWIAARYVQSLSLVTAPLFLYRKVKARFAFLGYTLVVTLLLISIFGRGFPDCYIEGVGLTSFKKASEYTISLILLASIVALLRNRSEFDEDVLRLLIWSIVAAIGSELAFTFYVSVYGFSNLIGHLFKIASFYLVYKALIETALSKPYNLMFRSLKQQEEASRRSEEKYRQQNQFLSNILESLPHPFYVVDANDYTVQIANSAARLGSLPEQATCYALTHGRRTPCAMANHPCPLEEVKRTKKPATVEHVHYDQDGSTRHVEVHAYPLFDSENNVVRAIEYALDITERKRAEEEKQSLARFPGENRNPVLRVSRDGTIRYANEASAPLLAMWSSQVGQKLAGTWRQLVVDAFGVHEGVATEVACGERIFSLDLVPVEQAGYANIYGRDITEQVQAREALRKSEALLKETQRMARVGGWELDLETHKVVWTEEVFRIHQLPLDFEPNLENALGFYVPEDRPILVQAIERAAETGEPWDLELQFIAATGRRLWVRAIGKVEYQDGKAVRLSGTFQDITERKQAEQALHEAKEMAEKARSEESRRRQEAERRRRIAESLGDVMAALNSAQSLDRVLDYIAAQAGRLLDSQAVVICSLRGESETLDIQAAQGLPIDCVGGAQELPGYGALRQAVASRKPVIVADVIAARSENGGQALNTEQSAPVVTQTEHCQALLAVPIAVEGKVYGAILFYYAQPRTFSDEEVEVAVVYGDQVALAIENARLRDRVEQAAVAAERSRLARDLHDSVTQALFSASLVAEVLPQVWRRDPHEAQQGLEELRHLTRGALAEMRTLLLELRPTALVETKLGDLLQQLTEAIIGRTQLLATLEVEATPALPPDVHVTFYRVGQEALHNVIKHAKASQVTVSLSASPPVSSQREENWRGQVRLRVSDDGQGFDPSLTGTDQLGLGIMRERAEAIGARLTIESQPGQGTQVTLVWQNI